MQQWIRRTGLVIAFTALPLSAHAQGRPLMAFGRQDLSFGTLLPGVSSTVSRFDAAGAGQFELRGMRLTEVRVTLSLPADMRSPQGNAIPLSFGSTDGGFAQTPNIATSSAFDPRVPLVTTFANNGRLYVWLGGTALPGGQQPAGKYAGTITVTQAYTGN